MTLSMIKGTWCGMVRQISTNVDGGVSAGAFNVVFSNAHLTRQRLVPPRIKVKLVRLSNMLRRTRVCLVFHLIVST
jgi:hypothetical protein